MSTSETQTITLASGRKLMISPSPFRVAEALNDAVMEECGDIQNGMGSDIDVKAMLSRLILKGFSSKRLKAAIWQCMDRALLDKVKVTEETFEPVAFRSDYYIVCYHVAEVNVRPFVKDLAPQFSGIISKIVESVQA